MDNEKEMMNAMRRGDQQAFGQIYDQYAPSLYGLALRLTESEQRATEVLQDAFRQMPADAVNFDPSKLDFFSWAVGIVKSLAAKRKSANDQFDFTAYQASHSTGVKLSDISSEIDEKHRRVIELAFFQGLSQQEIEQEMNIPVGTVSTRLRMAVRELRRVLK